jgi:hypothetical protein
MEAHVELLMQENENTSSGRAIRPKMNTGDDHRAEGPLSAARRRPAFGRPLRSRTDQRIRTILLASSPPGVSQRMK